VQQADEFGDGSLSLLTRYGPFIARPPNIKAIARTNPVTSATAMFHLMSKHPATSDETARPARNKEWGVVQTSRAALGRSASASAIF
jgi:hypothetical protein